jgi:hypothetical protein
MVKKRTEKVQVYLDTDVLAVLTAIANRSRTSVASLIRDSVTENLLGGRGQINRLNSMDLKLEAILERLGSINLQPQAPLESPKRKRTVQPTMLFHSPTPLIDTNETLDIIELLKRFKATTNALKAQLSIVGGSDGKVFEGDLTRARAIERCTMKHDPDNLPWMPVDMQRTKWVQMSALNWVLELLKNQVSKIGTP